MEIYIDAAFHPKRHDAGVVAFIKDSVNTTSLGRYLTQVEDNHQAEFKALKLALSWLIEQEKQQEIIIIHSDSQLVAEAVDKRYVKDKRYQAVFTDLLPLLDQFDLLFVKWIPEKENKQADQLAKQVLRKQQNWPFR
ncbi:ribonuclease HI family protein [Dolosicoccus paucivorans]|uniref:RNase H type-1 domain-containing protein n=1 Tax=Dolosicoccus paucivorans TaxID=84521 RepID=A0A1G8JH21_9LACT|nr:ribonuclease HI family protein [Dolosicoccus paucivorans]PMB84046.1 hypothetical protein CJ206_06020 [Dolosicoccus paucivorans]PMC58614.1 hypothetical protein CJ205_03270 [Dolosicoccus paucivorans]SDI30381.1 ribonuclease HI [Dolosicoccus paucivorans]